MDSVSPARFISIGSCSFSIHLNLLKKLIAQAYFAIMGSVIQSHTFSLIVHLGNQEVTFKTSKLAMRSGFIPAVDTRGASSPFVLEAVVQGFATYMNVTKIR